MIMINSRDNNGNNSVVNNNGLFSTGPSFLIKYLGSLGRDSRRILCLDVFAATTPTTTDDNSSSMLSFSNIF